MVMSKEKHLQLAELYERLSTIASGEARVEFARKAQFHRILAGMPLAATQSPQPENPSFAKNQAEALLFSPRRLSDNPFIPSDPLSRRESKGRAPDSSGGVLSTKRLARSYLMRTP
jgi:hypothetical protein